MSTINSQTAVNGSSDESAFAYGSSFAEPKAHAVIAANQNGFAEVSHGAVHKFPPEVFVALPDFLKRACIHFKTDIERDVFLLSALGVLSGCFPRYCSLYDNDLTSTNLFIMIYGVASAGKGTQKWARYLGANIHEHKIKMYEQEKSDFNRKQEEYLASLKAKKKNADATAIEKPVEPQNKLLFIPANSSASSVIEVLNANNGRGIIFSSESDTLSDTFSQDWGNYSSLLRSAFHGEPVSMLRRTNKEFSEIEHPWLVVVLSGTPNQLYKLIPDPENGLLSRFAFYEVQMLPTMKNVFASDISYDQYFRGLGEEVFNLYQKLESQPGEIWFHLTPAQKKHFITEYTAAHSHFFRQLGDQSIASVRRLALMNFRIAMILSMVRTMETNVLPEKIICNDVDFENAFRITEVLKQHAYKLYVSFPATYTAPFGLQGKCLSFFKSLPENTEFDLAVAMNVAEGLNINPKTAEGYLYNRFVPKGLVNRADHNKYIKPVA